MLKAYKILQDLNKIVSTLGDTGVWTATLQ